MPGILPGISISKGSLGCWPCYVRLHARQLRVPVNLPPVSALLPAAEVAANANLDRAERRAGPALVRVIRQLESAVAPGVPAPQRLMQLRYLAGQWSQLLTPDAACRKGCSHCCHINTDVPRSEAVLIAKRTGRRLAAPATKQGFEATAQDKFFGQPCPFLAEGRCSIYEHRPFACRTLVSLADDDQLCRLRPGENVPVPYANATLLQAAFFAAHSKEDWADIREWFP